MGGGTLPERSEAAIQRAIVGALGDLLGTRGRVIRVQSGGLQVKRGFMNLAPKGTPDLLVVLPRGRVAWIEVKRPGEDLTDAQSEWSDWAQAADHFHCVATSGQEAVDFVSYVLKAS